jgi:hypothetical protein
MTTVGRRRLPWVKITWPICGRVTRPRQPEGSRRGAGADGGAAKVTVTSPASAGDIKPHDVALPGSRTYDRILRARTHQ